MTIFIVQDYSNGEDRKGQLLSDNILTPILANPNLMQLACRNINPSPYTVRLLPDLSIIQRLIVFWIGNCHGPTKDEMGGYIGVTVRRIIRIPSIRPSEDAIETPGFN